MKALSVLPPFSTDLNHSWERSRGSHPYGRRIGNRKVYNVVSTNQNLIWTLLSLIGACFDGHKTKWHSTLWFIPRWVIKVSIYVVFHPLNTTLFRKIYRSLCIHSFFFNDQLEVPMVLSIPGTGLWPTMALGRSHGKLWKPRQLFSTCNTCGVVRQSGLLLWGECTVLLLVASPLAVSGFGRCVENACLCICVCTTWYNL